MTDHDEELHKHKAHPGNKYYLPPVTEARGEIGYISILTDFHFNEEVLYKEEITRFPYKKATKNQAVGMNGH